MSRLNEFYQKLQTNGLRFAYQFEFTIIANPNVNEGLKDFKFYATAANLPGVTMEAAELPFQGMTFRVPNNISAFGSPWSVTLRCDSEMKIRRTCENWLKEFADLSKGGGGSKKASTYKARVDLLGEDLSSTPVATYTLEGIFPTNVGEISLDTSGTDVATFTLELAFQYWYPGEPDADPLKTPNNQS